MGEATVQPFQGVPSPSEPLVHSHPTPILSLMYENICFSALPHTHDSHNFRGGEVEPWLGIGSEGLWLPLGSPLHSSRIGQVGVGCGSVLQFSSTLVRHQGYKIDNLKLGVSGDPISSVLLVSYCIDRLQIALSGQVRGSGAFFLVAKTLAVPHYFPLLYVQGSRSGKWKRDFPRATVLIVFRSKLRHLGLQKLSKSFHGGGVPSPPWVSIQTPPVLQHAREVGF